jgi:hypothetical protein
MQCEILFQELESIQHMRLEFHDFVNCDTAFPYE